MRLFCTPIVAPTLANGKCDGETQDVKRKTQDIVRERLLPSHPFRIPHHAARLTKPFSGICCAIALHAYSPRGRQGPVCPAAPNCGQGERTPNDHCARCCWSHTSTEPVHLSEVTIFQTVVTTRDRHRFVFKNRDNVHSAAGQSQMQLNGIGAASIGGRGHADLPGHQQPADKWSASFGTSGRHAPESLVGMGRIRHPLTWPRRCPIEGVHYSTFQPYIDSSPFSRKWFTFQLLMTMNTGH